VSLGRTLVILGLVLVIVGGLVVLGEKLGFGRLPGDLLFRRKGLTVSFPIVSCLLLSLVLTLVLNLIGRR